MAPEEHLDWIEKCLFVLVLNHQVQVVVDTKLAVHVGISRAQLARGKRKAARNVFIQHRLSIQYFEPRDLLGVYLLMRP